MSIGQYEAITINNETRSIAYSQRMTFIRDEQDAKIAECSDESNALIGINIFEHDSLLKTTSAPSCIVITFPTILYFYID